MAKSFPTVNGGDGAFNYAQNSQFQKESMSSVKAMIEEAIIEKLEVDMSSAVSLVDLGCAVGPNTFLTAQHMIEALEKKTSGLEFEVFFNDHASNDFNKLLASLPPPPLRRYHAAAVPGSFHGRLFSRARITLAHSCFAVHYLSKVPEEVTHSNEGRIHYTGAGASPHVLKGYLDQFERDMRTFLTARAEEIVKGGLMFLIIPGIGDGLAHSHSCYATLFNLIESSVLDLANEGVVGKDEIDGFNLPLYFPRVGEVREVIKENGSFSMERGELTNSRSNVSARAMINHVRAGLEGMFTRHFGESVMEKVFAKALAKADEASEEVEASLRDSSQLFYVLKRK
ncbi:loganic acid O-methyltransferase-like [Salvia miltiorrhiza]|uniref:loganic acid O-methyltransferase-like n=1 Tax=Salvia miltiorrhiza TaxID=226208 RepID=UPI0025ABC85A|nr:loganic acid O-methyltransferase-like [Salvia miltiorrhiza]